MNKTRLFSLSAVLVLAVQALAGCSFSTSSTSSESSSDSVKSVFDLSSGLFKSSSSFSADEQEKFEDDVADYTAEFAATPNADGALDDFYEHVSQLAKDHGITNWESGRRAYVGIGRGLKKAKLDESRVSAFTESLSGNDAVKRRAIEDGLKK